MSVHNSEVWRWTVINIWQDTGADLQLGRFSVWLSCPSEQQPQRAGHTWTRGCPSVNSPTVQLRTHPNSSGQTVQSTETNPAAATELELWDVFLQNSIAYAFINVIKNFFKNPGHPTCQNLLFNLFLLADITPKLTFLFNKEWAFILLNHSSSNGKNSQVLSLLSIFCVSPGEIHIFWSTRSRSDKLCQYYWGQNWLQPCWSFQGSQFTAQHWHQN